MADYKPFADSRLWLEGDFRWPGPAGENGPNLYQAIVHEGLSKLTETTLLLRSGTEHVDLKSLLGQSVRVHLMAEDDSQRVFSGMCISAESLGYRDGLHNYVLELRPWLWRLTLTRDCRIFQEMTAVEIIKKIFSDGGFADYESKLKETYAKRTYCVQYRESDYDFICRLMEEEGIYFFFHNAPNGSGVEKLILCDRTSAHAAVPGHGTIPYNARHSAEGAGTSREDHIAEWTELDNATAGKVLLSDYDFMNPTGDLLVNSSVPGGHKHDAAERFDYPGHHRVADDHPASTDLGEKRAQVRIQAEAVRQDQFRAASNVRALAVGQTFKLKDHPDYHFNEDYLVISASHYLQDMNYYKASEGRRDLVALSEPFPETMAKDAYACTFHAIGKLVPFRAPLVTPWPEIAGLQTATVVGPNDEEIYTDDEGRIKVKFHWDRNPATKKPEELTCWVRVVTPWSGTDWGMVALPRTGQEVVVQFEEGDPDRPICTGMLYNKPKKPAYKFPDDKTQLGIRTKSSPKGGETDYNELMFEDKKGSELMRVQAQKDHIALVKDRSVVTIGLDKHEMVKTFKGNSEIKEDVKDGSLWEVIKANVTRIINEGNHEFTIKKGDEKLKLETGSQTLEIKKDKTQTIEGKHTKTITGNDATTVKTGDMTIDVKAGKVTMKAMQSIELKVGQSSIKLEPTKITIKSMNIDAKADLKADFSGLMTNIKASAILVLKGALTKIN